MSIYGAGSILTASPSPGSLVDIDNGGAVLARTPLSAIAAVTSGLTSTAITTVGAGSLTAAAMVGGQIVRTGPVAAFTDTTTTAALIATALGGWVSGSSFVMRYKNATSYLATLAGGTSVTLPTTLIVGPWQEAWYYGTVGGTAAAPTVTLTHLFTNSISQAQGINSPQAAALSTVGAGTITAAMVASGIVARAGAQSNTAFTDTTDTAAAIIAASVGLVGKIGASQLVTYQNKTDANATITGGVGVTVSGITVVPGKCTAVYLLTYTAAATITMEGILITAPSAVSGTFICNGASNVTVADTRVTANSTIIPTLKTVGGTVGAIPAVKTITAGTGFAIAGTASDTSTYNYLILN